tara:strand:- start:43 stop:252 length:210 start_codon:yes stop_codon:yes gene_type:complete
METLNLTQITFEQFQNTDYYKQSFNDELVTDLSLDGAMDFMKHTFALLRKYNAILEFTENGNNIRIPTN